MSIRHVNYRFWLLRVITWDAILPVVVAVVPAVIIFFFPNRRGFIEITSVTLPVGAFLLRSITGKRQIARNRCSQAVRTFQFCVFVIGILPLVLVDCFMVLSHLMPDGALFATKTDRLVLAVLAAIYLVCMVVAMYPGSDTTEETETWSDEYPIGHEAGRLWALREAESRELIRLKKAKDDAGDQWADCFLDYEPPAYAPREHFVFTIKAESDSDPQMIREFWWRHYQELDPSAEFVHGFADGALEIYEQSSDE
jgi:hypothetical protein